MRIIFKNAPAAPKTAQVFNRIYTVAELIGGHFRAELLGLYVVGGPMS